MLLATVRIKIISDLNRSILVSDPFLDPSQAIPITTISQNALRRNSFLKNEKLTWPYQIYEELKLEKRLRLPRSRWSASYRHSKCHSLFLRKKHTGSNFIRLNAAGAHIVGIIFFFFSFKSCDTLSAWTNGIENVELRELAVISVTSVRSEAEQKPHCKNAPRVVNL